MYDQEQLRNKFIGGLVLGFIAALLILSASWLMDGGTRAMITAIQHKEVVSKLQINPVLENKKYVVIVNK